MAKVSVIVPVYKVEQYLNRCVESILNQTYKDLELILVDDGSPDKCGEICDKFVEQDSRVKCIHKKNGGLSSARNEALDIAVGEYIYFVDSDDWIEPELLEQCVKSINLYGADIVIFDWYDVWGECRYRREYDANYVNDIISVRQGIYWDNVPSTVWSKFYKAELWKDIRFPIDANFEDLVVMPDIFHHAIEIFYLKSPLYNYLRVNSGSISNNISSKSDFGIFMGWEKREKIARINNDKDLMVYACKRAMKNAISGYGLSLVDHSLTAEQIKIIVDYCNERRDLIYGIDIGIRYKILLFGVINCKFLCWIYGSTKYLLYRLKRGCRL